MYFKYANLKIAISWQLFLRICLWKINRNHYPFRYKSTPWRFTSPSRVKNPPKSCQHFQCVSGKPCMQMTQEPFNSSSQSMQMTSQQPQNHRQLNPKQCHHFICEAGRPCTMTSAPGNIKTTIVSSKQLNCSPQLQKVVYRAVNNNNNNITDNYWKPDRSNLKLNLPLNRATLV